MGLISGMLKAGLAKKAYEQARKPHNQEKIRQAVRKVTGKGRGGAGESQPPRRP